MSRKILGPFNRVEGDLAVNLTLENGRVAQAQVTSPLYRGFERALVGRPLADALVVVPRICGICSVSQSVAAVRLMQALSGARPAANGERVMNIVHACENLADHLTHFYLFFAPDLAHADYAGQPWHADWAARLASGGPAARQWLAARATLLRIVGLLAGRWPHTLALQAGGVTRTVDAAERLRLLGWLAEVRRFVETTLLGLPIDAMLAIDHPDQLEHLRAAGGDSGRWLRAADALGFAQLGRAHDHFLAFAAYGCDGEHPWPAGVWRDGAAQALNLRRIQEDVSHSWYENAPARHPAEGDTRPNPHKHGAYSWNKAPRIDGLPAETGALARQLLAGQGCLRALVAAHGGSVLTRVLARQFEAAWLLAAIERWLRELDLAAPFIAAAPHDAVDGCAAGLTEAARGALGHWATVEHGQITRYQIIAPTSWNFSPRDAHGVAGPLETALQGVADHELSVQHVVRSFDPCMVCTVH